MIKTKKKILGKHIKMKTGLGGNQPIRNGGFVKN